MRARFALSASAAAVLWIALLVEFDRRDSVDAVLYGIAAVPATPIPFLAEHPRAFRLAAVAYGLVFLAYAFVFSFNWALFAPPLLMLAAAAR